jgi:hypothetical protein
MFTTLAATALLLGIFIMAALLITSEWSELASHIGA